MMDECITLINYMSYNDDAFKWIAFVRRKKVQTRNLVKADYRENSGPTSIKPILIHQASQKPVHRII